MHTHVLLYIPHMRLTYAHIAMCIVGWLRLVGSLKSQVSFAGYSLFYRALLQKRPVILYAHIRMRIRLHLHIRYAHTCVVVHHINWLTHTRSSLDRPTQWLLVWAVVIPLKWPRVWIVSVSCVFERDTFKGTCALTKSHDSCDPCLERCICVWESRVTILVVTRL